MAKRTNYYNRPKESYSIKVRKILDRAEAMKRRRSHYENMWKDNIYSFVAFAVYDESPNRQFNPDKAPELQQYFDDRYSTAGFRFTDTRWPMEFAVIMRKMAAEVPNLPVSEWMIEGEADQSPALLFKEKYDQIMYEAEADYENFEIMLSKDIFGTSVAWSRMIEGDYMEREYDEKSSSFVNKETTTVKEFECSNVDLRNVLIDDGCKKSNLRDADDCIIFEYLSEGRAAELYPKIDFKARGIVKVTPKMVFQDFDALYGGEQKNLFEALHYYNIRTDTHCTLMNGEEISDTAIPMKSRKGRKKLPISLIIDHKIPGTPYGIGECTLTKEFRKIKNKNRNLIYDVTKKAAKKTIAVDPLSPFSEEKYTWGEDFIRIAPGDMQAIPVDVDLNPALDLDQRTDNDVIMSTGVNINDTSQAPSSEKATKTVMRKESQVAVVELGLTFNTNSGFRRMHTINADIIRLHLESPEFEDGLSVTTKNKKFFRSTLKGNSKFLEEKADGHYLFSFKSSEVQFEFLPVLKVGNLAVTDGLKKDLIREDIQLVATVAPDSLDPRGVAEVLMDNPEISEKILQKDQQAQPPADDPDLLAQQQGAVLPPDVEASNKLKNAQQNQNLDPATAGAEPVGAEPAPGGAPAAQPV